MYWCPYSILEVLDLYSLVLPYLGRIEVVIPTIVWLASVGFIIHCLHPSITFQLCFSPTYYLTCGMEDLSPLEPLLDKLPCLSVPRLWVAYVVFAYLKQVALPSIQCIWKWNEYLWKSPFMKSSVFKHTWMHAMFCFW